MANREEILSKISEVPQMPPSATAVVHVLRDPNSDIAKITRAIELDPGLTVNVLKLANSAYLGFSRSVSTVREAVVRVGVNSILSIVVAKAVAPIAVKEVKGYDLQPGELWKHSVFVAIASDSLAKVLSVKSLDFVFTAGLLHDIGKTLLGTYIEVGAAPIVEMVAEQGISFEAAERSLLGIDHAAVGGALLELWKLPENIVETVRYHHNPELLEGDRTAVDIVHVADAIGLMSGIGIGRDGLNYIYSPDSVSRLKLSSAMIENVMCSTLKSVDEINELLTK